MLPQAVLAQQPVADQHRDDEPGGGVEEVVLDPALVVAAHRHQQQADRDQNRAYARRLGGAGLVLVGWGHGLFCGHVRIPFVWSVRTLVSQAPPATAVAGCRRPVRRPVGYPLPRAEVPVAAAAPLGVRPSYG